MKTQEEKAKAYDNSLEKARKWYDANTNEGYRGIFEDIFPELKESEDERIRKRVITLVNAHGQGMYKDDMIAWLEKQGEKGTNGNNREIPFSEQKPAWSEEDERMKNQLVDFMLSGIDISKAPCGCGAWRKSFKDRVQLQPKQEWSEKDEDILNTIINHFEIDLECTENDDIIRWLKSLKDRALPQSTWKPSDEQMEAVRLAAEIGTANNSWVMGVLESMYQDLKKLRENSYE